MVLAYILILFKQIFEYLSNTFIHEPQRLTAHILLMQKLSGFQVNEICQSYLAMEQVAITPR